MVDLYRMINARRPGRVRYIQYNTHYIEYNFSVWQINPRRLDMEAAAQVISAAAAGPEAAAPAAGPRAGARARVSARVLVRVLVE